MEVLIATIISLITGFNLSYIFFLMKRQKEMQKTLDKVIESIIKHQSLNESNNKMVLNYISKLEGHLAILSHVPPNSTIN